MKYFTGVPTPSLQRLVTKRHPFHRHTDAPPAFHGIAKSRLYEAVTSDRQKPLLHPRRTTTSVGIGAQNVTSVTNDAMIRRIAEHRRRHIQKRRRKSMKIINGKPKSFRGTRFVY